MVLVILKLQLSSCKKEFSYKDKKNLVLIKRNFEVDIQRKLWANNKVPYVIIETSFGKISILNEFNIKRPNKIT